VSARDVCAHCGRHQSMHHFGERGLYGDDGHPYVTAKIVREARQENRFQDLLRAERRAYLRRRGEL
jgi:hypothetical protein